MRHSERVGGSSPCFPELRVDSTVETPHMIWGHTVCSPLMSHSWQMALLSPLLSLTGDPTVCSISNPDFVIYSSVVSFYVPFGVTVLVYARIYVVLRQRRRKRILTRQNSQCISVRPSFPQQVSTLEGQREKIPNPVASQPCVRQYVCLLVLPHWRHTADTHLLTCCYALE